MEGKNIIRKKRIEYYTILLNEELGEGSFGKVFKGVNEETKESVAIKMLNKKQINKDEYVREALVSEIKIMRKLKSKHIVALKDVLETSNNYYIIQEFCNGGDLRARIKKHKNFPEPEAVEALANICDGFLELISNGVVHRDVKPQNILMHDNQYKLADFGFAKSVRSQNQLNKSSVGTPLYMSPQVLKQERYSSKCDIWAIGLIFFQLLYGRIPWDARSEYQLITKVTTVPVKFPSIPQISANAQDFILRCLKVNEKDRISWREALAHPIFNNRFKQFLEKDSKMEEAAKYIINGLRMKVHSQNIDLEKLFERLRFTKESNLKLEQLWVVLRHLDPEITLEETGYIFKELDTDNSGTIEFQEFKQCLEKSGVKLNCLAIDAPPVINKRGSVMAINGKEILPQQSPPQPNDENPRSRKLIMRLKQKIDAHKLDLFTVYNYYDKNKDDHLSIKQFSYLLTKIDPSLTPEESKLCFVRFDLNGDGEISFQEFYKTICKIAGQPAHHIKK